MKLAEENKGGPLEIEKEEKQSSIWRKGRKMIWRKKDG